MTVIGLTQNGNEEWLGEGNDELYPGHCIDGITASRLSWNLAAQDNKHLLPLTCYQELGA